jgi:hypothetical protein
MASQPQKTPTPYDDEISLLDIIQFFKTNFKSILLFVILGGIIGFLYGKYTDPIYDGSVLISPTRVAGNFVVDPKTTVTKLNTNSYYPKETFLACNPLFYKDKEIVYDMSNIVKASITKDGNLIELKMSNSNKDTIHSCLDNIANNINISEKIIADPLIESKKNSLNLIDAKIKFLQEFREQLNDKQIKNLKTNSPRFATDVLYANIILNNASEIKTLMDQKNLLLIELSSEQTQEAGKALPINFKKISPMAIDSALIGLFFGLSLSILIALIKQMKI